jgi:hypothetical protein
VSLVQSAEGPDDRPDSHGGEVVLITLRIAINPGAVHRTAADKFPGYEIDPYQMRHVLNNRFVHSARFLGARCDDYRQTRSPRIGKEIEREACPPITLAGEGIESLEPGDTRTNGARRPWGVHR